MPILGGNLTAKDGGIVVASVIDNLKEISALFISNGCEGKVIQNEDSNF